MYYHVCEYCGAHLDPGESCDCDETEGVEQDDNIEMEDMV